MMPLVTVTFFFGLCLRAVRKKIYVVEVMIFFLAIGRIAMIMITMLMLLEILAMATNGRKVALRL